jgi:hypothetical protein
MEQERNSHTNQGFVSKRYKKHIQSTIALFAMFQPLLFSSYTKALLSIQINIPPSYSVRQLRIIEEIDSYGVFRKLFLMSSQSNNKNFPEQMFIKRSGRQGSNDNCNQSAKGGMAVVGR